MTAAYVDSSRLVAVLLGEPTGAEAGRMLASYGRLFASNVLEAEVCSAARREGVTLARPGIFQDLLWVLPGRPLGAEIDTVLGAGYLRGADLWHVACALYVRADVPELEFLTLDGPQRTVATALGFLAPVPVGCRPGIACRGGERPEPTSRGPLDVAEYLRVASWYEI